MVGEEGLRSGSGQVGGGGLQGKVRCERTRGQCLQRATVPHMP